MYYETDFEISVNSKPVIISQNMDVENSLYEVTCTDSSGNVLASAEVDINSEDRDIDRIGSSYLCQPTEKELANIEYQIKQPMTFEEYLKFTVYEGSRPTMVLFDNY